MQHPLAPAEFFGLPRGQCRQISHLQPARTADSETLFRCYQLLQSNRVAKCHRALQEGVTLPIQSRGSVEFPIFALGYVYSHVYLGRLAAVAGCVKSVSVTVALGKGKARLRGATVVWAFPSISSTMTRSRALSSMTWAWFGHRRF